LIVMLLIVTVAMAIAVPFAPVQVSVKVDSAVIGCVTVEPFVDFSPLHEPAAVQLVALVLDHVSVEVAPEATEVGVADKVTVGGCSTSTTTVDEVLPPGPEHVRTNVLFWLSVADTWLPDTFLLPDQAPDAVQLVAFVLDQTSVVVSPDLTLLGVAVKVTIGGYNTSTITEAAPVPPAPSQVNVKVLGCVRGPEVWEDDVCAVMPDQAPDAIHLVALVLVQVSIVLSPARTLVGFAASETAGGYKMTTTAEAVVLPPGPEHVIVNTLCCANDPVDWLPEVCSVVPDQAPDAVQLVAFVLVQVKVLDPPKGTDPGFAVSARVGG
jgi:hypothetical protein